MKKPPTDRLLLLLLLATTALAACSHLPSRSASQAERFELLGELRITEHRHGDDLLSAGLGQTGLAGAASPMTDAENPTAAELRRRAIQSSWQGLADLGPLSGYGEVYGAVPEVPGREYSALARLPQTRTPYRLLLQAPDNFDTVRRCLIVAPSSGSRGIYGAIPLAGAFGLPRGCAVVYTDKGTGAGYFDPADGSGTGLDGRRQGSGDTLLEFAPVAAREDAGIAVKHVHSGEHPEADWGRHVLTAARFGLNLLEQAYPEQAPFTAANTRILATGLSNGGGAVLQAAGLDRNGLLDAVMAMEPNIHVASGGRALFDYGTEAALYMPCALAAEDFSFTPLARSLTGAVPPAWLARCQRLHEAGLLEAGLPELQAAEALAHLQAAGWPDTVIATAASTTVFDVWRAVAAGYASAYLRREVGDMACGYSYQTVNIWGQPAAADESRRQAWWADASGIPPGHGIGLMGGKDDTADADFPGLDCLRQLWTSQTREAQQLHQAVEALNARLPASDLPVWIVHGADDGLIPAVFTSRPYVDWLRQNGRSPRYWEVPLAQHFDAFLALPGFGPEHVPLLPYAYHALEELLRHITEDQPLPNPATPAPHKRGMEVLQAGHLDLPAAAQD